MAEVSAKRATGGEPQGTMGRVQTAGKATSRPLSPSRLPLRARLKKRRLCTRQYFPPEIIKSTFMRR